MKFRFIPAVTAWVALFATAPVHAVPDYTFTTPDAPIPVHAGNGLRGSIWVDNGNGVSLAGIDTLAAAVPEPSTLALLAMGLLGFGVAGRRKRAS